MPNRPPIHRPLGWKPSAKRVNPMHAHYGTADWKRTREAIKRRDGYRCTSSTCTTTLRGYGGRLIVDHIVERSAGGSDHPSNLRTLCPACDNRRHGRKGR